MSGGYYQRNRDRGQYRGQNTSGGNYNQNNQNAYQNQSNLSRQQQQQQQHQQQQQQQQQVMNPWQGGMMPGVGGGMQGRQSDEAALAFSILNQVLSSDTPAVNSGQHQGGGFQDRNSRPMILGNRLQDRRRQESPQYSNTNRADRGSQRWSGRSRSPQGRDNRSNKSRRNDDSSSQNRKTVMDRLGETSSDKSNASSNASGFKRSQSKEGTPADKRKKTSDKERESSVDKSLAVEESKPKETGAPSDKAKDKTSKNEKTEKEKENEDYLIKCLKCHICEVDSFESLECFRNHKKSEEHKQMANIYHLRSEAVLHLMRADAKLSANRDREKSGNANKESFYTNCAKCDCIVADVFKSHKKSIEHELVDNHIFRECCASTFTKRKEFEDHRLTISHLKKQTDKKEDYPLEKVVMAYSEEEEAATNTLREYKFNYRLALESVADFPDYDANTPMGLGYVQKKRRYNCVVCQKSFPAHNNMALAHCRSFNHYLMLLSKLETELKDVEDDEITETDEKNEEDITHTQEEAKEEPPVKDDDAATEVKDEQEQEEEEEGEEETKDVIEDKDKENGNGNVEGEEEMGENLPPLEDGGIILEDVDKAAEDEGEGESEAEAEEEEYAEDEDDKEEDHISSDEQEEEPLDEGGSDESDTEKLVEEMKTAETAEDDEAPEEASASEEEEAEPEAEAEEEEEEAEAEEEEEEEEEEVVVVVKKKKAKKEEKVEVKPKATRGRRGRGRGRVVRHRF